MPYLLKMPLNVAFAAFYLAPLFFPGYSHAIDTKEKNPLRFYQGDSDSYLQATLQADLAVFNQGNSWFGNSKEFLGEKSGFWWESLIRPGIEGKFTVSNYQKVYGRVDTVQANTGAEIDGGGTNIGLGAVSNFRIDNAYAGWRSGNLFSSLGEDFLDISFGRQSYSAGTGFLFSTQGGGGYQRAAYYLGGRRSADYAGIVRMKSGGWSGDLLYLEADNMVDSNTRAGGATMEYAFEKWGNVGGGLYAVESDRPVRDSMNIYDIRGGIKPFVMSESLPALQPLKFEAEYVHEDKADGFGEGNGWYIATSYQFDQIPWKPVLTYRYASFDAQYDTLFYGASDWGSWFQGEIVGEYVLWNNNMDSDMIKLKIQPVEPVAVNFIYYHFTLQDTAAFTKNNNPVFPVTSDDYADEFDLIIDWAVNAHLTVSLVGAYALPGDGASQHTGGDENWSYMMLYGCVKF